MASSISSKNEGKQVSLKFHSSKVEFVCLFFGRNVGLKKSFRLCLTFNKFKRHLLTRNNNDRDIGLTVEAWLTGIQARVFKVDWWNGQSWDQGYFLQFRLIVTFGVFYGLLLWYKAKQNKIEYRVSHTTESKVILLRRGYRFGFLLIFRILYVHEIRAFMRNSSGFIFLMLHALYGSIGQDLMFHNEF